MKMVSELYSLTIFELKGGIEYGTKNGKSTEYGQ